MFHTPLRKVLALRSTVDWLIDWWLIDWLVDLLVGWLIGSLIGWLIGWLIDCWLFYLLVDWLVDWLIGCKWILKVYLAIKQQFEMSRQPDKTQVEEFPNCWLAEFLHCYHWTWTAHSTPKQPKPLYYHIIF